MDVPSDQPGFDSLHSVELMARVACGQRDAQLELFEAVGLGMHRTLHRLVGSGAPIEPLLEVAVLRAVNRASEYSGREPLTLWAQGIAAQVATRYLDGATASPESAPLDAQPGATSTPKIRDLLRRGHATLRKMRAEEQVAFALIELDGRSLGEAASMLGASPIVVRQRAARARRQLLFAARGDHLIAGYVRLADQLRRLARLMRTRRRADSLPHRPSLAAPGACAPEPQCPAKMA